MMKHPAFYTYLAAQCKDGRQRGVTLVELMVAMALGLLIALAAAASLLISRQGFTAVDAASQLRDNGRYLQSLTQRLGVQAGYRDVIDPAGFIHERLRVEVAKALGKLRDNAIDTLE